MKRIITLLLVGAALVAGAVDVGVRLPKAMLIGPIDPVCNDETGQCPMLGAAWLGNFAGIDDMRRSPFYATLVDAYPQLAGIDRVAVDTGQGSLWLITPLFGNLSLAVNEYDLDMFMGARSEDDAAVLLRTERAEPIVVRMTAHDPGQIKINAVDERGHVLTWIPTMEPGTNALRCPEPDVEPMTMDPIAAFAEPGRDYVCDLGAGTRATLRFYLNGQVSINGELGQYRAFHLEGNVEAVGLWLCDSQGRQTSARVTAFEQADSAFNLELVDGSDLGLGARFATFLQL